MNHTNGTDKMRHAQLMVLAENLYLLASRHRENGNYLVAHALYGRALETAQLVDGPEQKQNGGALLAKIQNDRQTVLEMLRLGGFGLPSVPLDKAQEAGQ